jgi:HAD superfamily hydrolase (TIGR01509 family)
MTDFRAGTRAVIFDLDGVIVDSEPLHQLSFRQLFDELGVEPKGIDDWQHFIGTSDRHGLIEMLDGREVDQSLDALLERKGELFLDLLRERSPLYPDIPVLVEALEKHYRLAVASGSLRSAIAGALELNGLRRHFKATVSVQDVPHGKPAPDLFLRAAELISEAPPACVVIEDSAAGVTAAKAAGMRVIAVTNTSPAGRLAHADIVVEDYGKVRELLLPPAH